MAKYNVTFETIISQTVEVEGDFATTEEDEFEDWEGVIDAAYVLLGGVPFIGWEFDAAGDWTPAYVVNQDSGEDYEVD